MSHTPEPWISDEASGFPCDIHAEFNGVLLARAFGDPFDSLDGEANARRIVACVNACAGIPTFYLEEKGLPSVNEHLSIEKQRDELMAALERMLRSYRVLKPVGYPLSDAEKIAESAIASVKGGACVPALSAPTRRLKMSAKDMQIGGNHYTKLNIQPMTFRPEGWISVNDRLPEVGRTPILVAVSWVKYGEHEDGTPTEATGVDVTEGEYVPAHGEAGGYFDSYQGRHGDIQHITHWMPLPAPPMAAARSGE